MALVSARATRLPVYSSFAKEGNLSDLYAKGEAISTLSNVLGLGIGIHLASNFASSIQGKVDAESNTTAFTFVAYDSWCKGMVIFLNHFLNCLRLTSEYLFNFYMAAHMGSNIVSRSFILCTTRDACCSHQYIELSTDSHVGGRLRQGL